MHLGDRGLSKGWVGVWVQGCNEGVCGGVGKPPILYSPRWDAGTWQLEDSAASLLTSNLSPQAAPLS